MKIIIKPSLFLLFFSIISISFTALKQRPATNFSIVKTKAGLISGTTNSDGDISIFKGIPFAAPPIGALRWKEPQPLQSWKGIKKCDHFSASAMQNKPLPFMMWTKEFMAPIEPLSEDCLYLNVWTAAKQPTEKRPVIVWIHGGAFTGGSGSVPLYDGEFMAKKGVVFVTINYRLGVFGFLAHPALSQESPHHVSGNYGLLDQIAALQWVKDNIAAFGGDENNVTIAGQSAGSFSVNALVASPVAMGLFNKAIAESGGMFNRNQGPTLLTAEQEGMRIMQEQKVKSIEELRALPAAALLKGTQMAAPVVDGYVLPDQVVNIFARGKQNDVPLLTGFNADEGLLFGTPQSAAAFKAEALKKYGSRSNEFLKVFPAGTDEEAAHSQKILSRDQVFGWQNYTWAKLQTTTGKSKVYFYYFSRVPPGEPVYGAFHSAEFGYALGTLNKWDRPFTSWDKELSDKMSSYWVNFATTGNPNGHGLPEWPVFAVTGTRVMQFGDQVQVIDLPAKQEFDFFDAWNNQK